LEGEGKVAKKNKSGEDIRGSHKPPGDTSPKTVTFVCAKGEKRERRDAGGTIKRFYSHVTQPEVVE